MHVLILLPHTIMKDVLQEKKAIVNQHILIFSITLITSFSGIPLSSVMREGSTTIKVSDEGRTLKMSAFKLLTEANLHYQLSL